MLKYANELPVAAKTIPAASSRGGKTERIGWSSIAIGLSLNVRHENSTLFRLLLRDWKHSLGRLLRAIGFSIGSTESDQSQLQYGGNCGNWQRPFARLYGGGTQRWNECVNQPQARYDRGRFRRARDFEAPRLRPSDPEAVRVQLRPGLRQPRRRHCLW